MSKKGKTVNRQVDAVAKKGLSDVFDDGKSPQKKSYSSYGGHEYSYGYGSGGYSRDYLRDYADDGRYGRASAGGAPYQPSQPDMFGRSKTHSFRGGTVTSVENVTEELIEGRNFASKCIELDMRAVDVIEEYMLDEIQFQFDQLGISLKQSNLLALGEAMRDSLEGADVSLACDGGKLYPLILKEHENE